MSRTNTVTGVTYRDDPTIMAWNLANELRCLYTGSSSESDSSSSCAQAMDDWTREMADHLHAQDGNHLVTTGSEGFFSSKFLSNDKDHGWWLASNPRPCGEDRCAWAENSGADFYQNHRHGGIDFATFHMWPSNWSSIDVGKMDAFVKARVDAGRALGKPVVAEEFGMSGGGGGQYPYFDLVYGYVERGELVRSSILVSDLLVRAMERR